MFIIVLRMFYMSQNEKKNRRSKEYSNESIVILKGADRVRLRPSVIFGSDDIEGCQHSIFEILSNSIDEARQGYGKKIHVTRYADHSIEIEDFGRGVPLDMTQAVEWFRKAAEQGNEAAQTALKEVGY